jgi:ATP adenylyltransferase
MNLERLWAPWRSEYIIEAAKKKNITARCFLCNNQKDTTNFYLIKGDYSFVLLNRYPYNPGHLLVAPYRHIGSIEKLSYKECKEIFELMKKSVTALKRVYHPHGFNIGLNLGKVAGAGLAGHLHFHIVPRWTGDTNFMTVLSNTRVINEELKKIQTKLKEVIEGL